MGRDRGHEDQGPPEGAVHGRQDQSRMARPSEQVHQAQLLPRQKTLTLSGAIDTLQGTTVSRFESYRFVDKETIASIVGIESNEAIAAWYSPYTAFPPGWRPMWAGGYARHYTSPTTD